VDPRKTSERPRNTHPWLTYSAMLWLSRGQCLVIGSLAVVVVVASRRGTFHYVPINYLACKDHPWLETYQPESYNLQRPQWTFSCSSRLLIIQLHSHVSRRSCQGSAPFSPPRSPRSFNILRRFLRNSGLLVLFPKLWAQTTILRILFNKRLSCHTK